MTTHDEQSLFLSRLTARLDAGRVAYGDASPQRPLATTRDEILAEVEDIAGWAFVAWVTLKRRLEAIESSAGFNAPSTHDQLVERVLDWKRRALEDDVSLPREISSFDLSPHLPKFNLSLLDRKPMLDDQGDGS